MRGLQFHRALVATTCLQMAGAMQVHLRDLLQQSSIIGGQDFKSRQIMQSQRYLS